MVAEADDDPNDDSAIESSGENPNGDQPSNESPAADATADSNSETEGFTSSVRNIGFEAVPVSERPSSSSENARDPTQFERPRRHVQTDSDILSTSNSEIKRSLMLRKQ